jgi:nucleoside-diphosphate-sugar epimerase
VIEGDIQSYERVHNAVRGCEVVLHQAALPSVPRSIQDPLTSNAVNVIGTLNVLLAARDEGVRRVVCASSSSVYGANRELPKTESMTPVPISPYAVGKLAGEGYCRSFGEVYGLETVALRYFNIFGPRQDPTSQYSAVVPKFIEGLLSGRRPVIYGDGEQSRDFTSVENVVDANLRAIDAEGVSGRVYNIACGERVTLNDLVRELCELTGSDIEPEYAPARPGDVLHSLADISRARDELGYVPAVRLGEGLARAVEHFQADAEQAAAQAAERG